MTYASCCPRRISSARPLLSDSKRQVSVSAVAAATAFFNSTIVASAVSNIAFVADVSWREPSRNASADALVINVSSRDNSSAAEAFRRSVPATSFANASSEATSAVFASACCARPFAVSFSARSNPSARACALRISAISSTLCRAKATSRSFSAITLCASPSASLTRFVSARSATTASRSRAALAAAAVAAECASRTLVSASLSACFSCSLPDAYASSAASSSATRAW